MDIFIPRVGVPKSTQGQRYSNDESSGQGMEIYDAITRDEAEPNMTFKDAVPGSHVVVDKRADLSFGDDGGDGDDGVVITFSGPAADSQMLGSFARGPFTTSTFSESAFASKKKNFDEVRRVVSKQHRRGLYSW